MDYRSTNQAIRTLTPNAGGLWLAALASSLPASTRFDLAEPRRLHGLARRVLWTFLLDSPLAGNDHREDVAVGVWLDALVRWHTREKGPPGRPHRVLAWLGNPVERWGDALAVWLTGYQRYRLGDVLAGCRMTLATPLAREVREDVDPGTGRLRDPRRILCPYPALSSLSSWSHGAHAAPSPSLLASWAGGAAPTPEELTVLGVPPAWGGPLPQSGTLMARHGGPATCPPAGGANAAEGVASPQPSLPQERALDPFDPEWHEQTENKQSPEVLVQSTVVPVAIKPRFRFTPPTV